MAQDQVIKCSECGTRFVWTASEQERTGAPGADAVSGEATARTTEGKPHRCPACRLIAPAPGRARGLVKWFSRAKGYGFITPTSGPDIFVHKSALAPEQALPCAGQLVEFAVGHGTRGAQAEGVVILKRDPSCA